MTQGLWLYRWFNRLHWPRSYTGKIFLTAFLAIHLPLLVLLIYLVFGPPDASKVTLFYLVLGATLGGTSLFLIVLWQLFKPVRLATEALTTYFDSGRVLHLPTRFRDEAGLLLNKVAYAVQTFEQRRITLEQLAAEDFLTKLPNRRAADHRLRQNISLALRDRLSVCIALLDIDDFKQINDRQGHEVGDQVIVALSQSLTQNLRGGDWVARWGGDEFLLVFFSDREGSQRALERIRSQLCELRIVDGEAGSNLHCTVSIGLTAVRPEDNLTAVITRADRALYSAKQLGRDRICSDLDLSTD